MAALTAPPIEMAPEGKSPSHRRNNRATRHHPTHDRVVAVLAAIPLVVTLCLVAGVVWISLQVDPVTASGGVTSAAYQKLLSSGNVVVVLANTVVFVLVAVVISGILGGTAAWLVGRTTLPGKTLVRTLMTVSVIIPGYLTAMGWVFLFADRIGTVNALLADVPVLSGLQINLMNPLGMGVVQGFSIAPLFFIMLVDVFRSADPSLEDAAAAHGLSRVVVIYRVILPLMRPSILAAAFYTSMVSAAAFDIPAIIGLSGRVLTLSTYLLLVLEPGAGGAPAYGLASALGVLIVIATIVPMVLYVRLLSKSYKYGIISGKGYRMRPSRLTPKGKVYAWLFLGTYFLFGQLLPLANTIWASLQPYSRPMSLEGFGDLSFNAYRTMPWTQLINGLTNSGILMLTAPTLAIVFALFISWTVVRARFAWRGIFDFGAFLPLAVPNVVFAMSMLTMTLFIIPGTGLYGSLTAILIVYVISHISFATRNLNGVLLSINAELDEVAAVHGIGAWRRLRSVILPLLLTTMGSTWLWLALLTYRELTVATFLATTENITLPAVIWSTWTSGSSNISAAATVVGLLVIIPLICVYWLLSRRAFTRVEEG
jgi:iron(III) transport system permease protein